MRRAAFAMTMMMTLFGVTACPEERTLADNSTLEIAVYAKADQSSVEVRASPYSFDTELTPEELKARCLPLAENVLATIGGVHMPRVSSGDLSEGGGLSFCSGAEFFLEQNVPRLDVSTLTIELIGSDGKVHFETGTFCAERKLELAGPTAQFRPGEVIALHAVLPDSDELHSTQAVFTPMSGSELYVQLGEEVSRDFSVGVPDHAAPGSYRLQLLTQPLIAVRECEGANRCVASCEDRLALDVEIISD